MKKNWIKPCVYPLSIRLTQNGGNSGQSEYDAFINKAYDSYNNTTYEQVLEVISHCGGILTLEEFNSQSTS